MPVNEGSTAVWFYFFFSTKFVSKSHNLFFSSSRLRVFEPIFFSFEGLRNQDFNVYRIVKLKLKLSQSCSLSFASIRGSSRRVLFTFSSFRTLRLFYSVDVLVPRSVLINELALISGEERMHKVAAPISLLLALRFLILFALHSRSVRSNVIFPKRFCKLLLKHVFYLRTVMAFSAYPRTQNKSLAPAVVYT